MVAADLRAIAKLAIAVFAGSFLLIGTGVLMLDGLETVVTNVKKIAELSFMITVIISLIYGGFLNINRGRSS